MNTTAVNYTVYSPKKDYTRVLTMARANYPDASFSISGEEEEWQQILISFAEDNRIKMTPMERVRPGDQFSKVILGTDNWIRQADTNNVSLQERMSRQIVDTQWMIGIRGINHNPIDFLFELIGELDGLLFNGKHLYDENRDYLER